jgi:hypothetical protein
MARLARSLAAKTDASVEYTEEQKALYLGFKNLEAAKLAVLAGEGALTAQIAHAIEADNEARATHLSVFAEMVRRMEAEPEPVKVEPVPARVAPAKTEAEKQIEATVTREDAIKRLTQADRSYMLQRERVENPSLPIRPDEVRDWPKDFTYFWVPAPPRTRPFHALEQQNLDGFIRDGWNFYPADLLKDRPNPQDLPWHPNAEADGAKVRWSDQWLMYRSAKFEKETLERARKRWNDRRQERTQGQGRSRDERGRDYAFTGTRVDGETTVDRVLRERNDDERDRDFLPR